jgi:hypothetical protein
MESCFTDTQAYNGATCTAALIAPATFDVATPATADSYKVKAVSASGNTFYIEHTSGGAYIRSCSTTGGKTGAGCNGSSW